MSKIKDPKIWNQIALEGDITGLDKDIELDNIDIDIITQLVDDGIPKIEETENNKYEITFDEHTVQNYDFQDEVSEYLSDNSLEIELKD